MTRRRPRAGCSTPSSAPSHNFEAQCAPANEPWPGCGQAKSRGEHIGRPAAPHSEEADIKRALSASAAETVALVSSEMRTACSGWGGPAAPCALRIKRRKRSIGRASVFQDDYDAIEREIIDLNARPKAAGQEPEAARGGVQVWCDDSKRRDPAAARLRWKHNGPLIVTQCHLRGTAPWCNSRSGSEQEAAVAHSERLVAVRDACLRSTTRL